MRLGVRVEDPLASTPSRRGRLDWEERQEGARLQERGTDKEDRLRHPTTCLRPGRMKLTTILQVTSSRSDLSRL